MSDAEGCQEMFEQLVKEMTEENGKRPSAKDLVDVTGLSLEEAKEVLRAVPPKKKQKTDRSAPAALATPVAAPAEPSASVRRDADLAETQLDESAPAPAPQQPPKEAKLDSPKPEAGTKAEDAKSEAPTQLYSPAPSPADVKQSSNNAALDTLARAGSQRPVLL